MKFHLNRKIILYYCNAFVLKKKVVNKSNNAWFNKIDINKFRKIAKTAKLLITFSRFVCKLLLCVKTETKLVLKKTIRSLIKGCS